MLSTIAIHSPTANSTRTSTATTAFAPLAMTEMASIALRLNQTAPKKTSAMFTLIACTMRLCDEAAVSVMKATKELVVFAR